MIPPLRCRRGSADTGTVAAVVIVMGAVAYFRYNTRLWTDLPIWAKVVVALGAFALARRHDAASAWPKPPAADRDVDVPPDPPPTSVGGGLSARPFSPFAKPMWSWTASAEQPSS